MKRHVFISSVFHSFINNVSCSLGFPSNAVILKGIARQAIGFHILSCITWLMPLMKCGLLWRKMGGGGGRERIHDSFSGITIKLFFFNTMMTRSICNENKQWGGGNYTRQFLCGIYTSIIWHTYVR